MDIINVGAEGRVTGVHELTQKSTLKSKMINLNRISYFVTINEYDVNYVDTK